MTTVKKVQSVLIIDDSESDVFLAKHHLNECGHYETIYTEEDGSSALEALDGKVEPDIIFLDLNMPRVNGFEFLEEYKVRNNPPKSAIIIMAHSPDVLEEVREMIDFTFVRDVILKPLTKEIAIELAHRFGR